MSPKIFNVILDQFQSFADYQFTHIRYAHNRFKNGIGKIGNVTYNI